MTPENPLLMVAEVNKQVSDAISMIEGGREVELGGLKDDLSRQAVDLRRIAATQQKEPALKQLKPFDLPGPELIASFFENVKGASNTPICVEILKAVRSMKPGWPDIESAFFERPAYVVPEIFPSRKVIEGLKVIEGWDNEITSRPRSVSLPGLPTIRQPELIPVHPPTPGVRLQRIKSISGERIKEIVKALSRGREILGGLEFGESVSYGRVRVTEVFPSIRIDPLFIEVVGGLDSKTRSIVNGSLAQSTRLGIRAVTSGLTAGVIGKDPYLLEEVKEESENYFASRGKRLARGAVQGALVSSELAAVASMAGQRDLRLTAAEIGFLTEAALGMFRGTPIGLTPREVEAIMRRTSRVRY